MPFYLDKILDKSLEVKYFEFLDANYVNFFKNKESW